MNMMFPKPTKQKKRKKHKKSIMQPKGGRRCYLCMLLDGDFTYKPYLEEHHVLFGNTHAFAEAEGLKVNLCLEHHRNGPAAVHNNAKNARILMAKAQEVYERTHTREEWMKNAGKNPVRFNFFCSSARIIFRHPVSDCPPQSEPGTCRCPPQR